MIIDSATIETSTERVEELSLLAETIGDNILLKELLMAFTSQDRIIIIRHTDEDERGYPKKFSPTTRGTDAY